MKMTTEANTYFMIRQISTGLYSTGGSYPTWAEKGKIWKQRNHATSHISNALHGRYKEDYKNAELVEFKFEPQEVSVVSLKDIIEARDQKRQEASDRQKEYQKKLEYEKAKQLVRIYENGKSQTT